MTPIFFYAPSMPLDDTAQPTATLLDALRRTGLEPVTVLEVDRQPYPTLPGSAQSGQRTTAQWLSHFGDGPPDVA